MKNEVRIGQRLLLGIVLFYFSNYVFAGERGINDLLFDPVGKIIDSGTHIDSLMDQEAGRPFPRRFIHRLGVEVRPGYVFPTNSFLQGMNNTQEAIRNSLATHLKYSFQFRPGTWAETTYGGAYQGIGVGYYSFGNSAEVGNPLALYLFQGARIVRFSSWLSFNYEWNFGLSFGWKPYDRENNRYNIMIGSKLNAYINTNFYFNWKLSPQFDLTSGIALTHFSNGNTRFPNAGMNLMGLKVGLVYNFDREEGKTTNILERLYAPKFPRHISYDLVVFGSWRRKGYYSGEEFVPSEKAYTVVGMNLAALYNVSYKVRAGASLDGVYDASANMFVLKDPSGSQQFLKPPLNAQIALGISGRIEYVMPFFTVGIGMGTNILHRGGDLKAFYQMLTLKISVTRNSFLHIGYNLQEFKTPNYLMLGVGFRFNNKYPVINR